MLQRTGYAVIADPDARRVEMDTVTCGHCQRIVPLHDRAGKRRAGVLVHCYQCDTHTCVPCAEAGRCLPFERKLERLEARERLMVACGGA